MNPLTDSESTIETSTTMLVVIGSEWLKPTEPLGKPRLFDKEDYVRIEIEHGFRHKLHIVPVLVAGATMPAKADLPNSIAGLVNLQAAEVRRDPDFHSDVAHLVARFPEIGIPKSKKLPA